MPPPLDRLTLYVRDVAGIADFYDKHFGYHAVPAAGGLMELSSPAGGCDLLLHPLARGRKAGQTLVKLGFQVRDVAIAREAHAKNGLEFGPIHQGDGYQFANAKDPAGNTISISSRVFAKTTRSEPSAPAIDPDRLSGLLAFLQSAEQLKDTLRSGTSRSGRVESTAEHSWRLCLMVLLFEPDLGGTDSLKLLKLCVLHDLGEAISGDVPAPLQSEDYERPARERADFNTLCAALPEDIANDFIALFDEYTKASSPEAQLAKAFDKLETILQHHLMPGADADFHRFNLTYGRERTDAFPLTRQIRDAVDERTQDLIARLSRT